jgi:hypothetical protein
MATNENIIQTIKERFLEITDLLPELEPKVKVMSKSVVVSIAVVYKGSAIQTRIHGSMNSEDVTYEIVQEIIDNCIFILNYFEFKSFKITSITLTNNQFFYSARFIR